MNIRLIPVGAKAEAAELDGTTAVVFDVLRATSTIVTALAGGYQKVYPVVNKDEALYLARGRGYVLAGERGGLKIPGFTLGNSPLEYLDGPAEGSDCLVLTTSNGTTAIHRARAAEHVLIGSLLNARAVARSALQTGRDVCLVCAGTGGGYALEDVLGAGYVLLEMKQVSGSAPEMDDLALTALRLAVCYGLRPLEGLKESRHGKKLVRLGMERDLHWCAGLNRYELVPRYNGMFILPR